MSDLIEIKVPNIGDFDTVEVVEILVSEGDHLAVEDSLITVESDKASMEIPCQTAGVVKALHVNLGDNISEGSVILSLEANSLDAAHPLTEPPTEDNNVQEPPEAEEVHASLATRFDGTADLQAEVVILGSGPGGYTAAFRAADLGKQVILIERHENIGGVCLNVGCIPSKALLHTAQVINEAKEAGKHGVSFGEPEIDIDAVRSYKEGIYRQINGRVEAAC